MSFLIQGPEINAQAQELNKVIPPEWLNVMTESGKRAFFPKAGILAQAGEAKEFAPNYNGSIGIATTEDGSPLGIPSIHNPVVSKEGFSSKEAFPYGPSFGLPQLREVLAKESGIQNAHPVIASGLTHALALGAQMFLSPGDLVLMHSFHWGNMRLMYQTVYGAKCLYYPFYTPQREGFNHQALGEAISYAHKELGKKKIFLYLNFPNNPTGYTPTQKEVENIKDVIQSSLNSFEDLTIVLQSDEAYYGLFFDQDIPSEPFASHFINLHPRLVLLMAKGPTKEDYVWGLRVGALWALPHGMDSGSIDALNAKFAGITRGTISQPSRLSQQAVLQGHLSPTYKKEKKDVFIEMRNRAEVAKKICEERNLTFLPFNAGYFFCVVVSGAEVARKELLRRGSGVIAAKELGTGETLQVLRVAFSCLPPVKLEKVLGDVKDVCFS